jgi:hypothetical protein
MLKGRIALTGENLGIGLSVLLDYLKLDFGPVADLIVSQTISDSAKWRINALSATA